MVRCDLRIVFKFIRQPHTKPAIGGYPASHLPSLEVHDNNITYICNYRQF